MKARFLEWATGHPGDFLAVLVLVCVAVVATAAVIGVFV